MSRVCLSLVYANLNMVLLLFQNSNDTLASNVELAQ